MPRWRYKTDDTGKPRRFLSHGEAAIWAARAVGKFAVPFVLIAGLRAIFDPGPPGQRSVATYALILLLASYFLISGALYLYVTLSGGVMNREERLRHATRAETSR